MSWNQERPDAGKTVLASRAVIGVAWTVAAGLVSRALGMVGTLLLTYFLDPSVIGEVAGASIVVVTASQLGTLGVGQYVITKRGSGERSVAWHATVIHQVMGVLVMVALVLAIRPLGLFLHSPNLERLAPGLIASVMVDRVTFVPERVLARDMRFRLLSGSRAVGEIVYGVCSVALAIAGLGGMAVVMANIARSLARGCIVLASVHVREWLTPHALSRETAADMLSFGWPLCIGGVAEVATRRWDNLGIERLFGPWVMGEYNQAYNLAEIPGSQIGEQMGDVLLPALASLNSEDKKRALVRSLGLMSLIVFPLSIGLGAVAPTLVVTVLRSQWHAVAPMLTVLCAISLARPFGWTISAYLQVLDKTRVVLWLDVSKVVSLLGLIALLGQFGPLWACAGVGAAYAANALASMWVVQRLDGIRVTAFLAECGRPLAACASLLAAVLLTRQGLTRLQISVRGVNLAVEIAAGGIAYVATARVVARAISDDLLRLAGGLIGVRARQAGDRPVRTVST